MFQCQCLHFVFTKLSSACLCTFWLQKCKAVNQLQCILYYILIPINVYFVLLFVCRFSLSSAGTRYSTATLTSLNNDFTLLPYQGYSSAYCNSNIYSVYSCKYIHIHPSITIHVIIYFYISPIHSPSIICQFVSCYYLPVSYVNTLVFL